MTILIVAAHPDDEVLGCGGTIARLAAEHDVRILILGEGLTARHAQRDHVDTAAMQRLHRQARQIGTTLGAREVIVDDLPDNRFDSVPLLDVVKRVERRVSEMRPEVVYTHHAGDLNIDHVITHRAVLAATRPMAGCPVRTVYAFEVASSTEWAFQQYGPGFRPNVFVDIESTLDAKVAAMASYESEARSFPHPRSPEALRAIARRWGSVAGLEAAEAFELIRDVRPAVRHR